MKDFSYKMFTDSNLASQYEWNAGRRASPKPTINPGNMAYKCQCTTEKFELDDCFGSPHLKPLKSLDVSNAFEIFIADWISVGKTGKY
jgi:hypothetical protein